MDIKQVLVTALLILYNPINVAANEFNATSTGDNFELLLLQNTPGNIAWLQSLGDNVHVEIIQTGDPSSLDLSLYGDGHIVIITQENGSQAATIELYNNGGPVSLTLDQQGLQSLPYDLITYCVNLNGCAISVITN
jgi:hypothetical protein